MTGGLLERQAGERDVRHLGARPARHYQVDGAARPLQNRDGCLVRDGRFQRLSVNRQDLVALGQSTISVRTKKTKQNKNKTKNTV